MLIGVDDYRVVVDEMTTDVFWHLRTEMGCHGRGQAKVGLDPAVFSRK